MPTLHLYFPEKKCELKIYLPPSFNGDRKADRHWCFKKKKKNFPKYFVPCDIIRLTPKWTGSYDLVKNLEEQTFRAPMRLYLLVFDNSAVLW